MSEQQKLGELIEQIKNERQQTDRETHENRMWVFWGFTFATASLAVARIDRASIVVSVIGGLIFFVLGCIEELTGERKNDFWSRHRSFGANGA